MLPGKPPQPVPRQTSGSASHFSQQAMTSVSREDNDRPARVAPIPPKKPTRKRNDSSDTPGKKSLVRESSIEGASKVLK